uniref:DUF4745 domain-containing protein n=1 Tax=Accipiter nisus TaxID=211598 RepID=A0A8B9MER3_9AVES
MYCCSAQESKMDYKRRFLLGGSKQKVQQHQQYQMPELGRTLSAPLASTTPASPLVSSAAAGSCNHPVSHTTPIADIQQGISKYLDALNVFCRTSTFLTDLFSSVFRNSHYSKAAMQLKDVQEHVMEAASRLTAAIKPEIAKMLMELSAGAANFKDQKEFSLQDIEVMLSDSHIQIPGVLSSSLCFDIFLYSSLCKVFPTEFRPEWKTYF